MAGVIHSIGEALGPFIHSFSPLIRIMVLLLSAAPALCPAATRTCREDPDFYQYLSGDLGSPQKNLPHVHLMQCDTMYVDRGVTVSISDNTYLAFADPKPENLIIVRGNMVVNGSKTGAVRISSSIDTTLFNPDESKKPWRGIQVENSGSLVLNHAMIYGAYIPVQISARELRIKESFFFNSDVLYLEGLENYQIPKDGFVADFSLQEYIKALARPSEPEEQPRPAAEKSVWKGPWPYVGAALLVGTGTAAVILLSKDEPPPKKVNLGDLSIPL